VHYINKKKQEEMQKKIEEFYLLSEKGEEKSIRTEQLMNELYKEFDKLILGVIRAPIYKFYQYGIEEDELLAEARYQIYLSIIKKQWDPSRGASLFSFYSTVVARNLRNYTKSFNKKKNRNLSTPIEEIFNEDYLKCNIDFEERFIQQYIFDEIIEYFENNEKNNFVRLAKIFKEYFESNKHVKFKKKDFISYANSYGFSQSFCNTFFENLKKIKNLKNIWSDLYQENFNNNNKIIYKNKNIE